MIAAMEARHEAHIITYRQGSGNADHGVRERWSLNCFNDRNDGKFEKVVVLLSQNLLCTVNF